MLKIFSVRDVKGEAYGALMCVATVGLAMRAFTDACNAPGSPLADYPADYSLYELGTFDPNSGTVAGHKVPSFIASAVEVRPSVVNPVVTSKPVEVLS
ncbi:MAG: nonstructural protein [Microvirus sp.]|nr:MAG: nonstructural protein [Microvirus sp.]